jgi:DNA-binding YbaB/EbfC family protein
MDFEKLMQQAQQMQEQMAKAQEELAGETVEASAGGGMVKVKATGALEITEITISPELIDPNEPELLADTVLAAVTRPSAPPSSSSRPSLAARWAACRGWDSRVCKRWVSPTSCAEARSSPATTTRSSSGSPLPSPRWSSRPIRC